MTYIDLQQLTDTLQKIREENYEEERLYCNEWHEYRYEVLDDIIVLIEEFGQTWGEDKNEFETKDINERPFWKEPDDELPGMWSKSDLF